MEEPGQPGAIEDRPVRRDRVLVRRDEDDEAPDEEGHHSCQDRRDDPPGALVEREPGRDARDGLRRGRGRGRGGGLAQGAASLLRPPVIAIPSSSSVTSGPYSAAIVPS